MDISRTVDRRRLLARVHGGTVLNDAFHIRIQVTRSGPNSFKQAILILPLPLFQSHIGMTP